MKLKNILFALILTVTTISCSKDTTDDEIVPNSSNVYVTGYEQKDNINQAKFWKNGIVSNLGVAGKNSDAVAVFNSGKDIYIVGQEAVSSASDAKTQIKLWKNGVFNQNVTNGAQNAVARDIYVTENDVYIAGTEYNGSYNIAKVWKNGVASNLGDATKETTADAITVSGNNVYVTGSEFDGMSIILKLWKNGVPQNLTSGVKSAEVNGLFVSNNDVYVTGEETGSAKFWKNGVATVIASKQAKGTGIYVSENTVFVIFEEYNSETKKWQGKLWKNGKISNITDGTQNCSLKSISMDGSDVLIVGSENNGTADVAKIWKNGTATNLSNGTQSAIALDIVVAKQ